MRARMRSITSSAPGADGVEAGVAEVARGPVLVHVAHAAVELHRAVGHLALQARAQQLADGGVAGGVLAPQRPRRPWCGAYCLQHVVAGRELGQHELQVLVGQQRGAEGPALAEVGLRALERQLDGADLLVEGHEALGLELHHLLLEAAADLADGVGDRHPHVGERQLRRVARPHAELLELARHRHAGHCRSAPR